MRRLAGALLLALSVGIGACVSLTDADDRETAVIAWINETGSPLAAIAPTTSTSDLAAFGTMIGAARLIGLGEATHGSREFFTMKDRLFRYLVETRGITGFAMEAPMAEAFVIDAYVRTGVGDPAVVLSHLYSWPWNTQEVLSLIVWLRQWNKDHPARQVGFYGFDVLYPGVPVDSVMSYVNRAAPDLADTIASDYACLAAYRNDDRGAFAHRYEDASDVTWANCTPKVTDAYQQLEARRDTLVASTSAREFDFALQMARVVVQWEATMRLGVRQRDQSMADNVGWLLDREGPDGKLFLWAHNYHISRNLGTMGTVLDERYGTDYLPVGFAFARGGLNAIPSTAGFRGSLASFEMPVAAGDSYEATFMRANAANYYADLRQATGEARSWLDGPRKLRSVGTIYFPTDPGLHYTLLALPFQFDVLIFIKTTTPSTLLPFRY